jgi:hypothetical protein
METSGKKKLQHKPAKLGKTPKSSPDPKGRTPLRKTGICVAREMRWGSHICMFYETKEDLLDTNAAYIKAGLDDNEYCIWAISEPITEEEAWSALRRDVPELDLRATSGQFEILPGYDWYLKGDVVDSRRITCGWHEKIADQRQRVLARA